MIEGGDLPEFMLLDSMAEAELHRKHGCIIVNPMTFILWTPSRYKSCVDFLLLGPKSGHKFWVYASPIQIRVHDGMMVR